MLTTTPQTLERSYLLRINGKVVERPQQMLMRVAVGIHKNNIDAAIETYNLLSDRWFTHASPTLFNAGAWFSVLCQMSWGRVCTPSATSNTHTHKSPPQAPPGPS